MIDLEYVCPHAPHIPPNLVAFSARRLRSRIDSSIYDAADVFLFCRHGFGESPDIDLPLNDQMSNRRAQIHAATPASGCVCVWGPGSGYCSARFTSSEAGTPSTSAHSARRAEGSARPPRTLLMYAGLQPVRSQTALRLRSASSINTLIALLRFTSVSKFCKYSNTVVRQVLVVNTIVSLDC